MNGKIPRPWDSTNQLTLTDWHGNTVEIAATAAISMIFSVISVIKAVVEFNIFRVHIQVIESSMICDMLSLFDSPRLDSTADTMSQGSSHYICFSTHGTLNNSFVRGREHILCLSVLLRNQCE